MVADAVALLFAVSESVVEPRTLAPNVELPADTCLTETVTCTVAPLAIVPSEQLGVAVL